MLITVKIRYSSILQESTKRRLKLLKANFLKGELSCCFKKIVSVSCRLCRGMGVASCGTRNGEGSLGELGASSSVGVRFTVM